MQNNPQSQLSIWKILIPITIGLLTVAIMLICESEGISWNLFDTTWDSIFMILLAFCFMATRDLGYIIRIRLFSRNFLSWKQAFRVIMLWEFTSAVTPSSVGGSAVATVFVHKEGLPVGRSATMVILTALMDEMFFVIVSPIVLLLSDFDKVFAINHFVITLVISGYCVKLILSVILAYGLFINPLGLKRIIVAIFSLPLLRRWKTGAEKTGDDIIICSDEIKEYDFSFWIKSAVATSISWCSRFLVANAIFSAFFTLSDQILVFVRQMAMWIPMIISPTPGGSGFAEYIFSSFLSDVTTSVEVNASTTAFIAMLWRMITYYPYLIIGSIIIPGWLTKSFSKKNSTNNSPKEA